MYIARAQEKAIAGIGTKLTRLLSDITLRIYHGHKSSKPSRKLAHAYAVYVAL